MFKIFSKELIGIYDSFGFGGMVFFLFIEIFIIFKISNFVKFFINLNFFYFVKIKDNK